MSSDVKRKKADIQQIVWHLDVGLSFPNSVPKEGPSTLDGPHFGKIICITRTVVGNIWTYT